MIQAKAVQSLADAHRRELMTAAGSRRSLRGPADDVGGPGATERSVAGLPVAGSRSVRRALAPRVGAWLIEFGIRLGGASVRTS